MTTFIIKAAVNGIKNLKKEVSVSFFKNKEPSNLNESNDRVRVIYGPNGVGKSSFILGVYLAKRLIGQTDFLLFAGANYLSQILNKQHPVFSFKCDFGNINNDGKISLYRYLFQLNGHNPSDIYIEKEALYKFIGKYSREKFSVVFEKTDDGNFEFRKSQKNESQIKELRQSSINVSRQQSLVAIIKSYVNKQRIDTTDQFGKSIEAILDFEKSLKVYLSEKDSHADLMSLTQKGGDELINSLSVSDLANIIKTAGFSWLASKKIIPSNDLPKYILHIKKEEKFIAIFKPSLKKIDVKIDKLGKLAACTLIMDYGSYKIDSIFESTGIKNLLDLYEAINFASTGNIVFIDEIDKCLSGVYLKKMIEFINEYGKGQLCFTSHSLEPMKVLANKSKSIYFLNDESEITVWTKNSHYKPYILYPDGMIGNIHFNVEPEDFIEVFDC